MYRQILLNFLFLLSSVSSGLAASPAGVAGRLWLPGSPSTERRAIFAGEGFFQPGTEPERPGYLWRAIEATTRAPRYCTGVRIAPNRVLTALHCVAHCLEERGLLKFHKSKKGVVAETIRRSPANLGCEGADVLYVGSGLTLFGVKHFTEGEVDLSDEKEMRKYSEDYAILSYLPAEMRGSSHTCLRTAPAPESSERVWALGYPTAVRRSNGQSSNGQDLYLSYGRRLTDSEKMEFPSTWRMSQDEIKEKRQYAKAVFEEMGSVYLFSDVDVYGGNSGGPLLNERSELVGVNVWSGATQVSDGVDASLFAGSIPIDRIRESIRDAFGETEAKYTFDCLD